MSDGPQALEGLYFDGRRPLASAARLVLGGPQAVLAGEAVNAQYPLHALGVSPRVAAADRFISFPDGGQLQIADQPLLDSLPQASPAERPIAWLEQRLAVALACIAVVIVSVALAYLYGLPAVAKRVAARIPIEAEKGVGRDALSWLEQRGWLRESRLRFEQTRPILEGFHRLKAKLPYEPHYQLAFRDAPRVGPNAFALPGGTIVITDQMVRASVSPEEVISIVAHEIGHIELRHSMRHVLQDSAIAALAAAVTSDAASLSVAVAGLPVLVAQAQYSQAFESEADEFAFALLKSHGYSPTAFAAIMERLSRNTKEAERAFSFVSSHPVSEERIKRARDAAR